MIKKHEFNTIWWGEKVGVVGDTAFFALPRTEQNTLLANYAWIEYSAPLEQADMTAISRAGFFQVDTQIHFLINLKKVTPTDSTSGLTCIFADDSPFAINDTEIAPFLHERFYQLPGSNPVKVKKRYSLWANKLISDHPGHCMRVESNGKVQGWFFAAPGKPNGVNLTLAMNHVNAHISGALLYQAACLSLAARGHRIGHASFSVTNTSVMNIYASMGAKFRTPSGNWLHINSDQNEG